MKDELIEAWACDLESGHFPQGRHHLRRINFDEQREEFCCLGVLANRLDPDSWSEVIIVEGEEWVDETKRTEHMTVAVYEWQGSEGEPVPLDPSVVPEGVQSELSSMNDDLVPFPAIAAWIRGCPELRDWDLAGTLNSSRDA